MWYSASTKSPIRREGNQHFGCTTGRVANRIAKGKFALDGHEYQLAVNNGPNHLHGGTTRNLGQVVWAAEPFENEKGPGVIFRYTSPDGEEGYPGKLDITVTYQLTHENEVRIDYVATTDKATPVNLTNHSYFNLGGEAARRFSTTNCRSNADSYTLADEGLIPTGQIAPVEGTPLDFRKSTRIGDRIAQLDSTPFQGYDHNYVLNGKAGELREIAKVKDPVSGRVMTVHTTEPGVQFYSGNFLKSAKGKGAKEYAHRSACVWRLSTTRTRSTGPSSPPRFSSQARSTLRPASTRSMPSEPSLAPCSRPVPKPRGCNLWAFFHV